jgi:opacity protein-like surface antigen
MIDKFLRSVLLVGLLAGLALPALSQPGNSFVGFNAGMAFPYGKFRSESLDGGSFAMNGFSFYGEGAWFFHPRFGIGASAGFNLNPVDVSALGWEKVQNDPFLQDVTIRSDPYLTITAMGGAYTKLPLWKKFSFSGKILVGLLYGETPYQLYKPEYFIFGPPYYEITSAKDWKFSWQAGAGIQYDVSPYVGLVLEGVILYDQLSFDFQTANGIRTDIHTIALINTTLGLRIRL